MKYVNKYDWADSEIEKIVIERDKAMISVFNDDLQIKMEILCENVLGITNLCMWDDIYIYQLSVSIIDTQNEFYKEIVLEYGDLDYGKKLPEKVYDLAIQMSNQIVFHVYCGEVTVKQ